MHIESILCHNHLVGACYHPPLFRWGCWGPTRFDNWFKVMSPLHGKANTGTKGAWPSTTVICCLIRRGAIQARLSYPLSQPLSQPYPSPSSPLHSRGSGGPVHLDRVRAHQHLSVLWPQSSTQGWACDLVRTRESRRDFSWCFWEKEVLRGLLVLVMGEGGARSYQARWRYEGRLPRGSQQRKQKEEDPQHRPVRRPQEWGVMGSWSSLELGKVHCPAPIGALNPDILQAPNTSTLFGSMSQYIPFLKWAWVGFSVTWVISRPNQNNLGKLCERWAKKPISYQGCGGIVSLLIKDEARTQGLATLKNRQGAMFLNFSTVVTFYTSVQMEDQSTEDPPKRLLGDGFTVI